jgi:uncharacterized protein YjbI with pentapeptide repeats
MNLRGLIIWTAWKKGANLQGANLQGANLQGANLQGANLLGADLQGANLLGANLRRANLLGANLRRANLRRANLLGANLLGANLQGANLLGADLQGPNLLRVYSSKRLLRINGFKYDIIINGEIAQIGCKHKTIQEWIDRDWTNSTVPEPEQVLILELFKKVFINE